MNLFKYVVFLTLILLSQIIQASETNQRSMILTTRGITHAPGYRAQENTLDAILAVKKWNQDHPSDQITGSEVHVVVVKPQNQGEPPIFVCSHDENLIDLTGQNINLHDLSKQQIQNLYLPQKLDGEDYGVQRHFAFFEEVLDGVMKDKPFMIWLNIKDRDYRSSPTNPSYTAIEIVKALNEWRGYYLRTRQIDIFNWIIVGSTNPFILEQMLNAAKIYHVDGLKILPYYSDHVLPTIIWDQFFAYGGFEKAYNFKSPWVILDPTLITIDRLTYYHQQGMKVLCNGDSDDPQISELLDGVTKSY